MAESTSNETDGGNRMDARDLALAAREAVEDLTNFPPESVSAMQWDGESWLVTVDVCELERIPNTTDVMATYVVQLNEQGGLLGYERTRRFQRAQAEGG
jgi:Gas vesicle synthesis protein GvpO